MCREAVAANEADRRVASGQHGDEVITEALANARRAMPADRGGGGIHQDDKEGEGRASDMQHIPRGGGGERPFPLT